MTRRSGVTLIEVLVSIFVTAIGLLALLALFPVGAFSMANAIKNGRCVQSSINATAFAKLANIGQDSLVTPLFTSPDQTGSPPRLPVLPASYSGPSYPVYVDPVGNTSIGSKWVGTALFPVYSYPSLGIPRTTLNYFTGSLNAIRCLTLLDDLTFNLDGTPTYPGATLPIVQREDRYTWAYMLQRPNASYSGLVNVTVVVYAGRSAYVLGESAFNFNVNVPTYQGIEWRAGTNQVDVTWDPSSGQSKPIIKNGTWVLDATVTMQSQDAATLGQLRQPLDGPHGYFYRVVGVTEIPGANTLTLELQTNIRASSIDPDPVTGFGSNSSGTTTYRPYGVLVVMENVAEVFEKGPM